MGLSSGCRWGNPVRESGRLTEWLLQVAIRRRRGEVTEASGHANLYGFFSRTESLKSAR